MNQGVKINNKEIKIFIEDTDYQGFVYHANYLKYFERARTSFLNMNGVSQKNLKKNNLVFVVTKLNIEFINPAQLEDVLLIETNVILKSNARVEFHQKAVLKENDNIICNAIVDVCLINLESKKPIKFDDRLLSIFKESL